MQWGRVKSIFIGIFLVINVILMVIYLQLDANDQKVSSDMIENTMTILKKNNIAIDEALLPTPVSHAKTFDLTNRYADAAALTAAIASPALPGFSEAAVNGSHFEYINPDPNTPVEDFSLEKAQKFAEKTLLEAGLLEKNGYISEAKAKGENFVFTLSPAYDNIKVMDSCMWVEVGKEGIIKIAGHNYLCDTATGGERVALCPYTDILTNFAVSHPPVSEEIVQIKQLEFGYYIGNRSGEIRTITAIPTYAVHTAEGEHYYDARNGNLLEE